MLTASFRPPSNAWYTRPPPPMQRRGRSRQVSNVALARQASEERRQAALHELHRQARLLASTSRHLLPSHPPPDSSLFLQAGNLDPPIPALVLNDVLSPLPPPAPSIPSDTTPTPTPVAPLPSRSPSPTPSASEGSSNSSSMSDCLSLSPDYYDSPPSPPRSLQDQVQVAYALDDIRLAKILLLKLKGVEITSDDDPRIDEVRDEDFDICFVPAGPLVLEEADRKAVQEVQRRERERWEQRQRMERLKACEKIWEEEKRRLRKERLRAQKKREDEFAREQEHRRVAEAREREELERAFHQRSPRLGISLPSREILSYGSLSQARLEHHVPLRDEDPFQYNFMPLSVSPVHRSLGSPKSPKYKTPANMRSPCRIQRSVSFKDVVASMHGQLFPLDPAEQAQEAKRLSGVSSLVSPACHRRKSTVRADLLDSLLKVVEWEEGEKRKAKGKTAQRPVRYSEKSSLSYRTPFCAACSAASTSASSSGTAASRASSWLSFGGSRSSTASVSTAMTSPAMSPISPSSKSPLSSPPSQAGSEIKEIAVPHCCHPQRALVPVPLADCPLSIPEPHSAAQEAKKLNRGAVTAQNDSQTGTITTGGSVGRTFVKRVSQSVTGFVEIARGLQSAYIAAALFSSGSPYNLRPRSMSPARPKLQGINVKTPLPEGYRVRRADVSTFIASVDDGNGAVQPVHFIPLVCPFPSPPNSTTDSTARMRARSPQPPIVPSPLRPRTPPSALAYRMRPVANPALLRLRALQNLMYARGKEWEGRSREGGLGCGKERMLGVAFEGRGRSGLGCEVRFVAVV
ncbi:hypothetical protein SERLA73DRAFT_157851 [Serpula lacrymans var. lacrymans S7.3]|uniref:Uncharacterized protein n=2 Tax=Serpula lacrymans var. lacrymans TaxID=341189 RepID=F8PF69_SERL3|nr:uncharacterized protein SERLADRAFT_412565 [Serpula lacrymans var. lacrymans S7.9]EGO05261.1 hypothetical protein SERLA73DRAFT_157851 [Serpula lacrymans var. lacrymans S7.3]EGO31113.1 hypothetical protein SERLADRAFT_412565 [Serpula lacrymans var. lacrymans S7.9]